MQRPNKKYPDGFIKRPTVPIVRPSLQILSNQDLANVAQQRRDLLYARRVRRASRIIIVAAKTDVTARMLQKKKRILAIRNSLRTVRQNSLRVSAVGLLCVFTMTSILLPVLQADNDDVFELNAATKLLVGETRDDAAQYLTYDDKAKAYTFAAPAQDKSDSYEHTGRDADAYDVRLPEKASEGVTITENNSKIAVTLTPKFFTTPAKKSTDSNLVYQSGNRQLVYTLKYNGLKEDIILPEFQGDTQQFGFRLSLPAGVEARLEQDGTIGIYSAEVSLFGDISFGSDDDRARVEKAREMGEKTNLVMTIPFPVVKDAKGNEYTDRSNFILDDHQVEKRSVKDPKLPDDVPASISTFNTYSLAVKAHNLKTLTYPISIDPTIKVTQGSDFYSDSTSDGIEIDNTNNLIKRSKLTGATVGAWATDTAVAPNSSSSVTLAYGKYLYYMLGGATRYTEVRDAPVGGSMITGWVATNQPPGNPANGFVAHNGYMYVVIGSGTRRAYHAKINDNGSLSTWTLGTTTFAVDRDLFGVTAYNGYIYVIGGSHMQNNFPAPDTEVNDNEVHFAPLNADGTVGSWAATASLIQPRRYVVANAYKGFIYVSNGSSDGANSSRESEYASVNSDGTLNTWVASSNLTIQAHPGASGRIYNGYMYQWGRWDNGADVEYAQINADGSLGKWYATTSFTTGRGGIHGGAIVNDYLFVIGGSNGSSSSTYSDIQYAKINPAGHTTNWTTVLNQFTSARSHVGSVAYNGYLYVSGGSSSGDSPDVSVATVEYAALNTDGSIGTWVPTTSFTNKRIYHDMVAYNGYLYIVGGQTHNGLLPVWLNDVQYASVNTNGSLSSWTATQTFDNVRGEHATFAHNGYLYIFGGRGGETNTEVYQDVQKATIGSNGALSVDFSTTGVPQLPEKRLRMNAVVNAGRIYIVAGCVSIDSGTCNNGDDDILFTDALSSTGTYTGWTRATYGVGSPADPDTTYDYGHPVMINGMMYIAGGHGGFNGVQFAPLNTSTGQPGEWAQSSTIAYRADWALTAHKGFIYAVGGNGSRTVSYAQVNNGGTGASSTWTTPQSLASARSFGSGAAVNGYLYHVGGGATTDTSNGSTTVQYTKILSNGALTNPWSTANMPAGRTHSTVSVVGSYLYVISGYNASGTHDAGIMFTQLNASTGAPGAWTNNAAYNVLAARRGATSVSNKGYIYLIGGDHAGSGFTNSTEYTYVGPNGGVPSNPGCGTIWCSTTALPAAAGTFFSAATVIADRVYVSGGYTVGNVLSNDTYYAQLTSSGIGSWTKAQNKFYDPRSQHISFSANGFLYIVGGGGTGCLGDVQYAPILTTGDIGLWSTAAATTGRNGAGGAYYEGAAFFMGGQPCAAPVSTVNRTTIQSIQREGLFSKRYDFGEGVKPTKLITRGTKTTGSTTNISYRSTNNSLNTLGNTQTASDISYGGANNQTISLGANRTLSQYLVLVYELDDSRAASFPDSGNESYITDFDLYFIANPDSRLKGGRTFIDGQDRGLDASPQ